jgi:hypothetical protein
MDWKKDCPFENIPEVKQMNYKVKMIYHQRFTQRGGA